MNDSRKASLLCFFVLSASILSAFIWPTHQGQTQSKIPLPSWTHISTSYSNLEVPTANTEQTATLILDINRDQLNDFVITVRYEPGPALVWYQQSASGWIKHVIESDFLPVEAGGAYHDIDGDGDLDIVMGADYLGNQVWWWENPYPIYAANVDWTRRLIKAGGGYKHHDQMFADVDNDGAKELVFWNQYGNALIVAEIPADPRTTEPWPQTAIYTWVGGIEHEGLSQGDIDGDGTVDIVGGGRWFKRNADGSYTANLIDDSKRFSRSATGQLKLGGRPEVVFVCGDCIGPLHWYEWDGATWVAHELLDVPVNHGHSLEIADMNGDGFLDIFNAEMRLNSDNAAAASRIFYGDGSGNFIMQTVSTGIGNHESTIGDLDNDGDLDILGKPFNWDTPRLDLWLNQNNPTCAESLRSWQRHVIDEARPWGSLFIDAADLDGDQDQDLITGGWWYQNPGNNAGAWTRQTIGAPLNNMAAVYDFDNDGDLDVIGTGGKGAESNATFVWARNDGAGNFTILSNIQPTTGNFLQGVAVGRYQPSNALQIAFSWHDESRGIQMVTVPPNPTEQNWTWRQISPISQGEALTSHDLDRDGNLDLLLGTQWLRNESSNGNEAWQAYTIHPDSHVDRNLVIDMNQDNRLDAVVGFEAPSVAGKLVWYEQPLDATAPWVEHAIASPIGPMSLDVQDMDQDGDWDVIVGEHNLVNPNQAALWIYENLDGRGGSWREQLVYRGDEHHDGAQTVDIDSDGDLDIISIGWIHNRVVLYENQATKCSDHTPTSTATPSVTPIATVTATDTTTATLSATPTATTSVIATVTVTPTVTPLETMTATTTALPTPRTTPLATHTPIANEKLSERLYFPVVIGD